MNEVAENVNNSQETYILGGITAVDVFSMQIYRN
jgi:hypothetical protein